MFQRMKKWGTGLLCVWGLALSTATDSPLAEIPSATVPESALRFPDSVNLLCRIAPAASDDLKQLPIRAMLQTCLTDSRYHLPDASDRAMHRAFECAFDCLEVYNRQTENDFFFSEIMIGAALDDVTPSPFWGVLIQTPESPRALMTRLLEYRAVVDSGVSLAVTVCGSDSVVMQSEHGRTWVIVRERPGTLFLGTEENWQFFQTQSGRLSSENPLFSHLPKAPDKWSVYLIHRFALSQKHDRELRRYAGIGAGDCVGATVMLAQREGELDVCYAVRTRLKPDDVQMLSQRLNGALILALPGVFRSGELVQKLRNASLITASDETLLGRFRLPPELLRAAFFQLLTQRISTEKKEGKP